MCGKVSWLEGGEGRGKGISVMQCNMMNGLRESVNYMMIVADKKSENKKKKKKRDQDHHDDES